MSKAVGERPLILSEATITSIREPGRLFEVTLANGYVALAVLPKDGPKLPDSELLGVSVEVSFSPYDMSRSKVLRWLV